jgi:hypothetical protein
MAIIPVRFRLAGLLPSLVSRDKKTGGIMNSVNYSKKTDTGLARISIQIILGIIVLLCINGCTAIGYGIGHAIDNRGRKPNVDVGKLDKDIKATITKRDGTQLKGVYQGLDTISESEYSDTYSLARSSKPGNVALPGIGDSVTIYYRDCQPVFGRFSHIGYKFHSKFLSNSIQGAQNLCLLTGSQSDGTLREYELDDIHKIEFSNPKPIKGSKLASLALSGKIPINSTVLLKSNNSQTTIPLQEIKYIQPTHKKCFGWIGFGTGLIIDVSIVALAVALASMDFSIGGPIEIY